MIEVNDLYVRVEEKEILKGLSLSIGAGEVHAIMGPNGAGKSTLSNVISGKDGYDVPSGDVSFEGQDLLSLEPEERAALGIFMGFQYPVEIPGVPNGTFLKTAVNSLRRARGLEDMDTADFLRLMKTTAKQLGIDPQMLKRPVNMGFSGGEKKRNEIMQMTMLQPKFAILDETDSGLDIDALKVVADGVNAMRSPERSFLVITHYQRLLDYIVPDFVHVLADGQIVRSGGADLAHQLEAEGYASLGIKDVA